MTNSFNFILVKDPHFMFGFRNNVRKHGWEKDIDQKIDQIIDYATIHNIQNIFFTGDIFEKNKKKDWSFNQLQQNKARLKKFKRAGLNVFSNMGNHDYFDGHETVQDTVFGEIAEAKLINYVGTNTPPVVFPFGSKSIYLYGIDHHQSINKILDRLEYINTIPEGPKIVLMHSNITDKNIRVTDFTYDQLSKYNIDIIGCGHWHLMPESGAIAKVNSTYFLNPWNLTRVTREYHVKLDEHKPEFIKGSIVQVGDDIQYSFEEIFLNVKPFSEAFNIDIINMLQELGEQHFDFFKEITLDQQEDMNDDDKLIQMIAETHSISQESLHIAKELLQ